MSQINREAILKKMEDAAKLKFKAALDALTSQEREQVTFENGEIVAPPDIKAKITAALK